MNPISPTKTAVSLQKIIPVILLPLTLVFLTLWLMTSSPTLAGGYSCGPANTTSWNINDESFLNFVIGTCYNQIPTPGSYTFSISQDINLNTSTSQINNNRAGVALIIEGNNHVISGQNISGTRVLNIANDTHVTLQNITIADGNRLDNGGGINNAGTLTLTNSTIRNNEGEFGGGMINYGTAMITNSTFISNTGNFGGGGLVNYQGSLTAVGSEFNQNNSLFGGGIHNYFGTLTMTNSTLISNTATVGGGINNSGTLTMTDSTLSDNSATGTSGGIHNSGTLTMLNSTLSGSFADQGGGISNISSSTVTLINSTISNNKSTRVSGGGIFNQGLLTLIASTISNNSSADTSGGISNSGTATMSNSTISGNTAVSRGGGIYNTNAITITNSTISDNSANGGIFSGGGIINYSSLSLNNTIIANSPNGGDCVNYGADADDGHNLVEDNGCQIANGGDPMLGPLQNNGGPTLTHALLFGSHAINAGNTTLTTDQRGITRPANGSDDIGAFEYDLVIYFVYLPMIAK